MNPAPPTPDLAACRAELAERGFSSLGVVLSPAEVAALNAELAARRELQAQEYGILAHQAWEWHRGFEALVRGGLWAGWVRELLQVPAVLFFQDNLVWKPPGTATPLEWHQDYSYWPLSAPAGLTLWLALDDADPARGCLHYLPGTHREGERQPADFVRGAGQPPVPGLPPLDWERRAHAALAAPARAGELLVHDPLVWHMSPGNTSREQRRAWSTSWVPADQRWDPAHAPHPFNYQLALAPGERLGGPRFPRFGPEESP